MKKVAKYLSFTVGVLLMVAAVFIYLGPHIGWRVDAVLSGSMEPEIKVGSLVVTHSVDAEEIEVGDVITFYSNTSGENMITHRVVGIGHSSSLYFETKGDANDELDPFTTPAWNLLGKVTFHVPYWGYFTEFLKTPLGFLLAVVIPGSIIIVLYIITLLRTIAENKRQVLDEVVNQ
jgi:signal peptidase